MMEVKIKIGNEEKMKKITISESEFPV